MAVIEHPTLGRILGHSEENVTSFRGLKYATLEDRFASPQVVYTSEQSTIDATKAGPTAATLPGACDVELHGLMYHSLPHDEFVSSDLDCLNLTITKPNDTTQQLPVFVFIHGGGFMLGSHTWPQYDLVRIVGLSLKLGTPVIGVGVNYRLGAAGFLDSQELRGAGVAPNRGLLDQRASLLWIQMNIAGFGGDPARVTVIGESAGAVSCMHHLHSTQPLFRQMVAMGGTSLLMKPLPADVSESTYRQVIKSMDTPETSASERLQMLIRTPAEQLVAAVDPKLPLSPVLDKDTIPTDLGFSQWAENIAWEQLPGTSWCERVFIGECQFDGSIFALIVGGRQKGIANSFQAFLQTTFKDNLSDVNDLLDNYQITPDVGDEQALMNILRFANDIAFNAPALTVAKAWPKHAYIYHFNEPNPWNGHFRGEATRMLDIVFLLQNFNEHLSDAQAKVAESFASDFIHFVNGDEPFPPHSTVEGGAKVYGSPCSGRSTWVQGRGHEQYGRRGHIWTLAEKLGFDALSRAWDAFVAGAISS